jgi:transcriptional regulator with XRE-family HTH domain
VSQWRIKRGLSMQRLADHTDTELGKPIPRNVLANLASGRRDYISVGELFILARALDVAPVDLLFPAEAGGQAEVAPGEFLPRDHAVAWLSTAQCLTCDGKVPVGFTCNTCRRVGS